MSESEESGYSNSSEDDDDEYSGSDDGSEESDGSEEGSDEEESEENSEEEEEEEKEKDKKPVDTGPSVPTVSLAGLPGDVQLRLGKNTCVSVKPLQNDPSKQSGFIISIKDEESGQSMTIDISGLHCSVQYEKPESMEPPHLFEHDELSAGENPVGGALYPQQPQQYPHQQYPPSSMPGQGYSQVPGYPPQSHPSYGMQGQFYPPPSHPHPGPPPQPGQGSMPLRGQSHPPPQSMSDIYGHQHQAPVESLSQQLEKVLLR
ncbi:hypothetical protein ADUPG1_013514 [Aduncisulcus paluster]|uniref:Uncharacterized protein n=1 Tax=Aduncisulcus paluster TaxID=2918883 RepID=A0ABQ5K398_9EUKA|nr:hypothetical protein ADUPG1_013514 [Aduncisulcus paluster]